MGSTCRADEEIRASLAIECGSAGIAVLDYRDACGSWSYRNFNCCSPDGTGCGPMRHDGSPSSCKDEGTWRKYSDEDCAKDGKVVGKFTVDTACGGGGHRGYSFTCCAHP